VHLNHTSRLTKIARPISETEASKTRRFFTARHYNIKTLFDAKSGHVEKQHESRSLCTKITLPVQTNISGGGDDVDYDEYKINNEYFHLEDCNSPFGC